MIVAQLIFSGVYPIPAAFYEVRENPKKMPLGLARNRIFFMTARHKAGFASGKCAPGVGKVWERVPAIFLDPTPLALDDCIPYLRADNS